jgi:hypothetical protein
MANNTGIKYGGRQKGTPNKETARLREAFTELLEDNMKGTRTLRFCAPDLVKKSNSKIKK